MAERNQVVVESLVIGFGKLSIGLRRAVGRLGTWTLGCPGAVSGNKIGTLPRPNLWECSQ